MPDGESKAEASGNISAAMRSEYDRLGAVGVSVPLLKDGAAHVERMRTVVAKALSETEYLLAFIILKPAARGLIERIQASLLEAVEGRNHEQV